MRRLGLDAYRFSLSWTRVLPAGAGRVEPRVPELIFRPPFQQHARDRQPLVGERLSRQKELGVLPADRQQQIYSWTTTRPLAAVLPFRPAVR
ncbi:family 1 glycosylhydrolase [Streptomyces sp. NPDC001274]